MHLQRFAPDDLVCQIFLFVLQRISPFARHGRRLLTHRQAFSLGVIDIERDVTAINIVEEPLFGELWVGHGTL